MRFALLASGSRGNCCVVKHHHSSIIIDCGTTKKYLNASFEQINYDYHQADALLITHTHQDHISQIKMFNDLPTYSSVDIKTDNLINIRAFQQLSINEFKITVLPLSHDSERTVGYIIEADGSKLAYITDTGYVSDKVKQYIRGADYYIMESNHDISMLLQTSRPMYVKQRIIGDCGHLCNEESADVLSEVIDTNITKEIVLAHISQEGNTRELALNTLKQRFEIQGINYHGMRLHPAGQYEIYVGGNYD